MKSFRFIVADLFICVPFVLLSAGMAGFVWVALPRLEAHEAELVRARYRDVAEAIKDGEARGVRSVVRGMRKSLGRLSRGTWGVDGKGEDAFVWYAPPNSARIRGVVMPTIEPYDFRRPVYWVGGLTLLLLVVLTDVGLRRFRRFSQEREDFMAATVHDLATPLLGLELSVSRDPAMAKVLVQQLQRLVENLRTFVRLGGQHPKPQCVDVDVVAACREAYAIFQPDYEDSFGGGVSFDREEPLLVRGDPTWIVQICWNLFGNDLKYAAPFGKVSVRFAQEGRFAYVSWVDEGPGLNRVQRRRAFDRYYRARTARTTGKGGFGIGLCTSREFARLLDGDLTVGPNRPRGCVFTLKLPCS